MDDKISRVSIPKDLEELIPAFMANRRKDIQKLREALAAGDFEQVRQTGHRIKGIGSSYGFHRITELGREIEDCAKAKDAPGTEARVAEYADYVERVEISFE
jgi:HPt (histidine-containing phosphotransfer) domain-containing protein